MLQHLDELESVLSKFGLDKKDIVIIGSGAISICGGRLNNDIEFAVSAPAKRKLPLMVNFKLLLVDHVDLSTNVDIFHDRYLCAGIRDADLFQTRNHVIYKGFRIVIPEIEYAYKKFMGRPKDLDDFEAIKKSEEIQKKINWEKAEQLCSYVMKRREYIYMMFRNLMGRIFAKCRKVISAIGGG